MPKFAYKAVDAEGNEDSGIIEAESESDALSEISRKGLFVEDVRPAGIGDEWRMRRQESVRRREVDEAKRQDVVRRRHARQRLVVRYRDGLTKYGVCYALNTRDTGFHLEIVDTEDVSSGETVQVLFSELKAVFYVKSFDGKYDKSARYREWAPEGSEVVVEFEDGEMLRGFTLHTYNRNDARFYLVPSDSTTNNISILVEAVTVKGVYSPKEYHQKKAREKEARKTEEISEDLCQEETMGDFYFETRNYPASLAQYQLAAKRYPQAHRIRRKVQASEYNIGVQHIKSREYGKALKYMERILKVDPENRHAKKKALQLRRILHRDKRKREGKRSGESSPAPPS